MKVPFRYRREEHRHLLAPHRDATLGSVAGPGRTEGVNMQSGSASPAIAIAPRSVVQVRMPEDGSTGSGAGEGEAVPTVSAGEEGNLGEENELWEDDDEEEVTRSTMQNCLGRRSALTVPDEELIHLKHGLI